MDMEINEENYEIIIDDDWCLPLIFDDEFCYPIIMDEIIMDDV